LNFYGFLPFLFLLLGILLLCVLSSALFSFFPELFQLLFNFFVSFLRAQVPLFLKGLPVAKLCAWGFSFWYLFVRYLHDFACPGRRVPSGDRKSPGRSRVPAQDMEMEAA